MRDLAYVSSPFSQDSAPDKQHAEITQKLQIRREIQEDTNGNSRKKDSKNLLLHKNNEKTGRDDRSAPGVLMHLWRLGGGEREPALGVGNRNMNPISAIYS